MADPRAGDVAEAERLLAQAAGDGIARLPVLSAAELWVLCGDQQVLADVAEQTWWSSMTDAEREKYAVAMTDFLADRQLIRRPSDPASDRFPMTAELAMIVAARQFPAVVAICTQADGSADNAPRMYGLAEAGQPTKVLVCEVVQPAKEPAFGPLHHFSLVSPERAGRLLALWAAVSGQPGLWRKRTRSGERIVDVYRSQAELSRDRVVVSAAAGGLAVIRQRAAGPAEPPQRASTEELGGRLTAMLRDHES